MTHHQENRGDKGVDQKLHRFALILVLALEADVHRRIEIRLAAMRP